MNKADMIEERIERRERKKTMTLNEYIAENGDKILMSAKERNVTAFDIWFKTEADCNRAIDSLTKDEVAALCWTGDEE